MVSEGDHEAAKDRKNAPMQNQEMAMKLKEGINRL